MYEYVSTASPEFFKGITPEQIGKWASDQIKFMKKEFGSQLKLAVLHLDEKTPYLHFFVSTEIKSLKKYRNRYGVSEKETWSLNSKRYDPDFLRALQDRYAHMNKTWGLRRGVKGSKRKNIPLKKFYNMVDRVMATTYKKQTDSMVDNIELTLGERLSIEKIRDKVREQFLPFMKQLARQQKALKEVVKLDMHKMQAELIEEQKKLKQEEAEVFAMKEVYSEAINGRWLDIEANEILLEHNGLLTQEIERLRARLLELEPMAAGGMSPLVEF